MPMSASTSSRWPLPSTPAMPNTSPARTSSSKSATVVTPRSSSTHSCGDVEHDVAGRGGRLVDGEGHVAAHHQRGEGLLGGLGRVGLTDHLPAPEHDDAVGDGEHLAELVGDEDDRLPLLHQALDHREELVDLAGREHGRGLVEDEDVGLAVERLDELDALLLADRQVADDGVRDRSRARSGRRARGCVARAPSRSSDRPLRGSSPRTTFSTTVNTGISWKCWCTMPIPAAMASRELPKCTGSPRSRICPSSGWYSPNTVFTSVLLPAPFSPRRQSTSPSCSTRSTSWFAMHAGEPLGDARGPRGSAGVRSLMPLPPVLVARTGAAAAQPPSCHDWWSTAAAPWPGRGPS